MIDLLVIQLTSECNLNCEYCYSKEKFKSDNIKIKNSIKKVLLQFPIKEITITGGEPLLEYNFLIPILKELNNKEIEVRILTNGFFLDKKKIDELKKLNVLIRISIDGFRSGEKNPPKELIKLIKENPSYLKSASKVITKKNLKYLYEDFLKLVRVGFRDIDIIPEMYIYWDKKERDLMIREMKKIIQYCLKNDIQTSLLKKGKSGEKINYECNKIRILPDGDISLCNALNSTKKTKFINNGELEKFERFREEIIGTALNGYHNKEWFKKEYLGNFCIVEAFYYNYINDKDEKWILSAIDIFSRLNDIGEKAKNG